MPVALFLWAFMAQGNNPMTLLSEDEVEPIHSAIVRREAWTIDPVRHLRAEADKRLREGPWSVTNDRPKDTNIDAHEYYSEAAYYWPNPDNPTGPYIRKDGQANPARFTANRTAMLAMSDAVFTLGTAAFLLDNPAYGQRAATVIRAWFLTPKTRMNPGLDYAQSVPGVNNGLGSGVIDGRPLIHTIQGIEFLEQTGHWDPKEQAAVRRWFEEYLTWLTQSRNATDEKKSDTNHASSWTAQVAAIASFVGDTKAEQMAYSYYRSRIFPRQVRPNGAAPREETFNLEAFTTICRIAQVRGAGDLWTLRARNGATLGAAIDYVTPYLLEPKKWTKDPPFDIPNDSLSFLAFAGMGLNHQSYLDLFHKMEHPESAWISLVDLMVSRFEAAAHQTRH